MDGGHWRDPRLHDGHVVLAALVHVVLVALVHAESGHRLVVMVVVMGLAVSSNETGLRFQELHIPATVAAAATTARYQTVYVDEVRRLWHYDGCWTDMAEPVGVL